MAGQPSTVHGALKRSNRGSSATIHSKKKLCKDCLSSVHGTKACCGKKTLMNNLLKICVGNDVLDEFLCMALREKAKNGKTNKLISLRNRHKKEVKLLYNYKQKFISRNVVNLFRQTITHSTNRLKKGLRLIRKSLGNRFIEPKVEKSFQKEEELFTELVSHKVSLNI